MNATPQTIQVQREIAHHARWAIAKLVPEVFSEQHRNAELNVTGNNYTIRWMSTGDEGNLVEPRPDAAALPEPT